MAKSEQNLRQISERSTKVEVSFPSRIYIELVQGNELRHYEIFSLLASLSLSIAVGFWTAYITTPPIGSLHWSAGAFTLLAIFAGAIALYYRRKMYDGKITKTTNLDDFKLS